MTASIKLVIFVEFSAFPISFSVILNFDSGINPGSLTLDALQFVTRKVDWNDIIKFVIGYDSRLELTNPFSWAFEIVSAFCAVEHKLQESLEHKICRNTSAEFTYVNACLSKLMSESWIVEAFRNGQQWDNLGENNTSLSLNGYSLTIVLTFDPPPSPSLPSFSLSPSQSFWINLFSNSTTSPT